MSKILAETIKVADAHGKVRQAHLYKTIIAANQMSGTKRTTGSGEWILDDGRDLNTDDDQSFEDLDGNAFTRASG